MSGPTRFGTTNLAVAATCAVQNGVGLNAPAAWQDAAYPMTNVLLNDRMLFWATGALPSPAKFDLKFTATQSLNAIGVHGLRMESGAMTSIEAFKQTGSYNGTGTWTSLGLLAASNAGKRDWGLTFASTSVDSIRLVYTATGRFHHGKVFAGATWNLGSYRVSDPGNETSPQRNAVVYTVPAGSVFTYNLGDTGRKFSLSFSHLSASDSHLVEALADLVQSWILVDHEDRFWDVLLADKQVAQQMTSAGPRYQARLALQAKP